MKAILCLTTKSCVTQCVIKSCSATLGSSTGSLYQLSSPGECLSATKETLQQSGSTDSNLWRNLLIFPPASTSGYWTGCSRPSGNRRWEEHVSAHPETEANGAPVTRVAIPWIRSWSVKARLSWFSSLERWSEMLASNGTPTPVKEYQGVGLDHWNCIQSYRPTAVSLSCNLAQLRITQCQAPFPNSSLDTATSLETKTV